MCSKAILTKLGSVQLSLVSIISSERETHFDRCRPWMVNCVFAHWLLLPKEIMDWGMATLFWYGWIYYANVWECDERQWAITIEKQRDKTDHVHPTRLTWHTYTHLQIHIAYKVYADWLHILIHAFGCVPIWLSFNLRSSSLLLFFFSFLFLFLSFRLLLLLIVNTVRACALCTVSKCWLV